MLELLHVDGTLRVVVGDLETIFQEREYTVITGTVNGIENLTVEKDWVHDADLVKVVLNVRTWKFSHHSGKQCSCLSIKPFNQEIQVLW